MASTVGGGPWEVISTNRYSFANDPVKVLLIPGARSATSNAMWASDNNTSNSIFTALKELSYDLLGVMRLAQTDNDTGALTGYSIKLASTRVCPSQYIGAIEA
jgi:hypothetical protein